MAETALIAPETAINNLTHTVSDMVYQYIHEHNSNNAKQDYFIATVPELRQIIQKAMEYQGFFHFLIAKSINKSRFTEIVGGKLI